MLMSGFIKTLLISSKPASCHNAARRGLNAVAGEAPPEQDMTGIAGRGGEEEATVTLLRERMAEEVREDQTGNKMTRRGPEVQAAACAHCNNGGFITDELGGERAKLDE
jgi:hypothetical protein